VTGLSGTPWPSGHPLRLLAELEAEPWEATITQIGRWRYSIDLHRGMTGITPGWSALGRQRAERKALRLLAREARAERRRADAAIITGEAP